MQGNTYSQKKNETWTYTWTPGTNLENLFALYDSLGDVTISGATEWATDLDGPIKVFRAGALTVNAALTFSNRCRGVVPLVESFSMGASGSISMTGKGAAGSSKWVSQDIAIPSSIVLTGKNTSLQEFFAWIRQTNYFLCDPNLFASPPPGMGDVTADYTSWPSRGTAIISATGCGSGATSSAGAGTTGGAGTSAPGGGGSGAGFAGNGTVSCPAAPGRIWGGGSGSGGIGADSATSSAALPDLYGGQGGAAMGSVASGGGAGNPGGAPINTGSAGGSGTGGIAIIIVRGAASLTTGNSIQANGVAGGAGSTFCGGGGSGGGRVVLLYVSVTGTPSLVATGGAGGAGTQGTGGAGGAGATTAATLASFGL